MSLREKWEEFIQKTTLKNDARWSTYRLARMREAFYAGAEAALKESDGEGLEGFSAQAEIDHFRSHK